MTILLILNFVLCMAVVAAITGPFGWIIASDSGMSVT
jgi:hypothetical protein